jgi:hypothetical protein
LLTAKHINLVGYFEEKTMMMTTPQSAIDLNGRQRAIRRRIFRKNPPSRQESEPREEAVTFTGWCKKTLAVLKGLKEAVATLTWLKAIVASLFGMGFVFYSSASHVKLLSEMFPQADAGQQFVWANPDGAVKAGFARECAKPKLVNALGLGGASSGLRLQYGLVPAMRDGGWGVHWDQAPTHHFDASGFAHFSFWVRGARGEESFEIGLKDTDARETKIDAKDWIAASDLRNGVEVIVPLTEFKGVKKQSLNNVSFSFNALHGSGSICIDSMAFGGNGSRA